MKLEDIGFYTLSDERAANVHSLSNLQRCELILTDKCNFKCAYCRGMKKEDQVSLSFEEAMSVIDMWTVGNVKNIRLSGGEPTVWKGLISLVQYAKAAGIERIALSTNGSASTLTYDKLIRAGVNDFSISLDACCANMGNQMAGVNNVFQRIVDNIIYVSLRRYTTVGVVITEQNQDDINNIIKFAHELGVDDIRIIPAAQLAKHLDPNLHIDDIYLKAHPILKYRYNNLKAGNDVRGIQRDNDRHKCPLVLDDMAVMNGKHYPCIIYMREHGKEIGRVKAKPSVHPMVDHKRVRLERLAWFKQHNTYDDPICKNNCLDVCVDYNDKVWQLNPYV